jgi:hypothetical protein
MGIRRIRRTGAGNRSRRLILETPRKDQLSLPGVRRWAEVEFVR